MIKRPHSLCLSITRISVAMPHRRGKSSGRPDPSSALHRLKNLDTAYQDQPHEPEDDGEGPGTFFPPPEKADHRAAANCCAGEEAGLEKVKEARAEKEHGKKAIYLSDKNGEQCLCPHCGKCMEESNTYTDAKGWTFHRPCLHKGSVQLREKKAGHRFLLDYLLPPDPEQFDLQEVKQAVAPPPVAAKPPGGLLSGLINLATKKPSAEPDGGLSTLESVHPAAVVARALFDGIVPPRSEQARMRQDGLKVVKNELEETMDNASLARKEFQNALKDIVTHATGAAKRRIDQVDEGVGNVFSTVGRGYGQAVDGVAGGLSQVGNAINSIPWPSKFENPVPQNWRTGALIGAGALTTGLGGYGLLRYLQNRRRPRAKTAQFRTTGTRVNAPTVEASNLRDRGTMLAERGTREQPVDLGISPNVALPLIGTAAGGIMGDHPSTQSRLVGALRGLAAGSGAALGQHLAGAYSGGDTGSRLVGGAGAGALAYLLARAVTPDEEE